MVTLKTLKASEEDFTNQQVTSCSYCPCFILTVVLLLVSWATNFRGCLSVSSHPEHLPHCHTNLLHPDLPLSPLLSVVILQNCVQNLFFIFQSHREKVATGASQCPSNAKGSDYTEIHANFWLNKVVLSVNLC